MERYDELKKGEKGAWISIVTYIALSSIKLVVGLFTHSQALIADSVNNITDIIASGAVLIGLKVSRKPPDEDHPYGHFRAETIASMLASFIMMVAGIQVLIQAGRSLMEEQITPPNITAAWTALGCAFVMFMVYRYNKRLGQKINSQAVKAAAKDNLSDGLVSIGAAVGIFGSQFGLPWLDPVAATLVGIMICKTSWDIFVETAYNLTDGFDQKRLEVLRKTVETIPGVGIVREIKARVHGSNILVDVVILVDPTLSVRESHDIAEKIERKMYEKHHIDAVQVHIEPINLKTKR